jgi:hypothetical protein
VPPRTLAAIVALSLLAVAACTSRGPASTPSEPPVASAPPPAPPAPGPPEEGGPPPKAPAPEQPTPSEPGWVLAYAEDFEALEAPTALWRVDEVPDDGPFSDAGAWFTLRGVKPPAAFRATAPFGKEGWLTAESYTRSGTTPLSALIDVVPDPAGGGNRVLRIASPAHTDGTVVRSSEPLPSRYRVSLRVGFADFGDGLPGLNGYDGGESAEPWSSDDATAQNGFYWLTILDALPRPHNNTWIHHHRKVVIDSDSHHPPWMQIFDGNSFVWSGQRPIMMFALDGKGRSDERTGKPFLSWANGAWQPSGAIRAVDAYLPEQWYEVSIERFDTTFTLELSGRFRFGGQTTYRASIDAAAHCVWHFNRDATEDASHCVDQSGPASLGGAFPWWPAGAVWPDWFMFGDPHTNYYEGEVYYDDVRLEVWREAN